MKASLYKYSFLTLNSVFLLQFAAAATIAAQNDTDKLALQAFKDHIIKAPFEFMSSWNESLDHCQWNGVSCSTRHVGRVIGLNLTNKKLFGSIPPHFGNLSFLRYINLSINRFRGIIPPEISRLSRLRHIDLSYNEIRGEIPSNLSFCSNLQVVDLTSNQLEGSIPQLSISKLIYLSVSMNRLTGNIPPWLANTSSLERLYMARNNFHGKIPEGLGRVTTLLFLQVASNNLSGTVPPSIFNLSSLVYIDMGNNRLHGTIPSDIGYTLPHLQGLYIYRNRFTGQIPASLVNATGIVDLSLGNNSFTGTMPVNIGSLKNLERLDVGYNQLETSEVEGLSFLTSLTNCTKLRLLGLSRNKLTGQLPASVANFTTNLEILSLGSNYISGLIPEGIENLRGLTLLILCFTNISGEIPSSIGKLENMKELHLFGNKISGTIPASIGNITGLSHLYLFDNILVGSIPSSLGNCQKLEVLSLAANNLSGIVPNEVASISSMSVLFNLSHNYLTGPLPEEIGSMTSLVQLDVSHNKLSGEVPSTLSKCVMLEQVFFQDNLFEGSISSSFSALKSVHVLDLSRNDFSGEIPNFFHNLTLLENLNLSFNRLDGEVPLEGVFSIVGAVSVAGNQGLCGGSKSLGLLECDQNKHNNRSASIIIFFVMVTAISFLIIACASLVLNLLEENIRQDNSPVQETKEQFPMVLYADLSRATNEFSTSNLLGKGSYGSVFEGIMGGDQDGMVVAVKVINLEQKRAFKAFVAECDVLRSIRHRNIIKVITICSSIDFKGAEFKAIVYEYMQNGSLEEWLHHNDEEKLERRKLNLIQRLTIAIDVASAIEYLHYHCETSIVHGDIKPSNILLDQDMIAHVADFGLARFLPNALDSEDSSIGIKGTIGYIAPEYGMGSELSMTADMYSYGILLLEMFTGRKPTDEMFNSGLTLHEYAKKKLHEDVLELVEPCMIIALEGKINRDRRSQDIIGECLVDVVKIGVVCSTEKPMERMQMKDVVPQLQAIQKKLLPCW